MYTCPLTKSEIVNRIVKEKEMYIFNAEQATSSIEKEKYKDRIWWIETLMKVLEIEKPGS